MPEACNMTVLKRPHFLSILTDEAQIKNKYHLSFKIHFPGLRLRRLCTHLFSSIDLYLSSRKRGRTIVLRSDFVVSLKSNFPRQVI